MNIFNQLYAELEAPADRRKLGQGWVSGVFSLLFAGLALGMVLTLHYPSLLSMPEIHRALSPSILKLTAQCTIVIAFVLAVISLILNRKRLLGMSAMTLTLLSLMLGAVHHEHSNLATVPFGFSLDWFMLNLLLTGILFLPLERLFYRVPQQVFRDEWREDLFYFFISSVLVQFLTYCTLAPSKALLPLVTDATWRDWVGNQALVLQLLAIMFLTDFVQYWVHRLFHQVPALWRFHAVHHSAKKMDWLAGSRMHVMEIIMLRAVTVIPMNLLGFSETAIYSYLIIVYLYATYIHANLKWDIEWLKPFIVTPRFHHWHHGVEKEAIDVNFSIHFPIFDRLFGTYYMPKGQWPSGYGIDGHPVPTGYWKQFCYPLRKK